MKADGNKVTLSFTNIGGGLVAKNGSLQSFYIAGSDHIFHKAQAVIDGSHIVVSAADVSSPVAVRFAWSDWNGEANLFNKEGFPAVPFRTDDWKEKTTC